MLDVKTGNGAFMKTLDQAVELARAMVDIGKLVGRRTMAVISDMNQPLGNAVGNALEVREAIDTLKGQGPADVYELCLTLGSYMVYLGKMAASPEEARSQLEEAIASGKALETFRTFVAAQGGDPTVVDEPGKLPTARFTFDIPAKEDGFVAGIRAEDIGTAAMILGAGRATKDSPIDLAVGLVLHKKIGDRISKGEPLATLHSNREDVEEIRERVYAAYSFKKEPVHRPTLIYETIRE